MHVVVTGSTGFIGSALVPKLMQLGHDVTVITRRPVNSVIPAGTGVFKQLQESNLSKITERSLPNCDAIIHLAGIAHRKGKQDNATYERVNYQATVRLAEVAAANNCRRFIFMSTAKVHAESTVSPINSSSPYNPPDLYSETKARAEHALLDADWPMAITALRPPAVLGLPAKANFKHLIRLATSGLIVPVPKPANSRSFIGLENLCAATIRCLENEIPVKGGYLVHDGSPISTANLLEAIAEANGRKLKVVQMPQSLFKLGNKTIATTTGKNLLAPFFKDFEIDCDQFAEWTGWTPEYSTEGFMRYLFSRQ